MLFRSTGAAPHYQYSRFGNPTVTALETRLAALEGANAAVFHAAAMFSEAASILEERAHFFLIGQDWLAERPRGEGGGGGTGAPAALAKGAA